MIFSKKHDIICDILCTKFTDEPEMAEVHVVSKIKVLIICGPTDFYIYCHFPDIKVPHLCVSVENAHNSITSLNQPINLTRVVGV